MPGPCKCCGDSCAPFGYRRRGVMADLPPDKRTMIFVCGAPACLARAEDWKRKADAELAFPGGSKKPKSPARRPAKPSPAQGSLF